MFGVYLFALILGGGMLLLSLAGGHSDAHASGHGGGHGGHGAQEHAKGIARAGTDVLSIFLSLRFWTFFLAFGGLSGLLLTALKLPVEVVAVVSGLDGLILGSFAAAVMARMSRDQLSSARTAEDWVGRSGRVTIPVSAARQGKIRLELEEEVVDLIASVAEADGELAVGTEVIVVALEDGVAKVTPAVPGRSGSKTPAMMSAAKG